MIGRLPDEVTVWRVVDDAIVTERQAPRPPEPAEVVVSVAGSALGRAPGCEVAGVVVATGDTAAEWLGRRVVVPRVLPCGECPACRRARSAACERAAPRAGVASVETVPARYLVSAEPPLWPEALALWQLAALPDALALPYAAWVRLGLAPGDVAIVIGDGALGRCAARVAQALGALPVRVGDGETQAAAGPEEGVVVPFDAADATGLIGAVRAAAGARAAPAAEWKVLETGATGAGRRAALQVALSNGGALALTGGGDGRPIDVPFDALAASEARVIGVAACHPDLLPELLALVVRGALRFDDLVHQAPPRALAERPHGSPRSSPATLPILVAQAAPDG